MSTEPKPQANNSNARQQQWSGFQQSGSDSQSRIIVSTDPFDGQYYWELTRQYAEDGRWTKVLEVLSYIVEHQAPTEGQLMQLAQAHYHLGQLSAAEERLSQLLEINADASEAYCLLGVIAKEKFQFQIAENYIRQSLELDNQYAPGWIELAKLFKATGHYPESQKACQGALMMVPVHPIPHQILGETEALNDNNDKAEQYLRQAVDLLEIGQELSKKEHSGVFNALANHLYEQDELEEAMTYYAFSLNVYPEQSDILQRMGALHAGHAQFKEALKHYTLVMEYDPDNARNYYELGQLYYHLGNLDASSEAFNQAIELAPKMTDAYYELGANYYEQEAYTDAKKCFSQAAQLEPNYDLPYYSLGLISLAEGKQDKASRFHQQLVQLQSSWATPLLRHIDSAIGE